MVARMLGVVALCYAVVYQLELINLLLETLRAGPEGSQSG